MSIDTDRLQRILSIANEGFWEWNLKTDRLYLSPKYCELTGYSHDDTLFDTAFMKMIIHPDDHQKFHHEFQKMLQGKKENSTIIYRMRSRDGSIYWIESRCGKVDYDEEGRVSLLTGTISDITERVKAEEERLRLNRALLAINSCNQTLVHAHDEMALLNEICRIVVETGGYRMAWVGYAEHDEAKSVRPVAQAGIEDGYIKTTLISWADVDRGRGPAGTAIRTGRQSTTRNMETDPQFEPWRKEATDRGYNSVQSLPLITDSTVFGVLNIYSIHPDSFDAEETKWLMALAENLAYGITMLRTRKARELAEDALRQSEERYRNLFQNKHTVMLIIDPEDGRIIDANPAAVNFYGWALDELCCMNIAEINLLTDEEIQSETELARKEQRSYLLFRHRLADGSVREVELFSGPISMQGKSLLYSIVNDITDRKKLQETLLAGTERMHFIMATTNAGIWEHELGTNVNIWSDELWKLYGLEPGSFEPTYENWLTTIIPEDRMMVEQATREAVKNGAGFNCIWRSRDADGTVRWLMSKGTPFRDAEGNMLRYAGIVIDITDRKKEEEALRESENRFKNLFEGHSSTMLVLDPDSGYITDANQAAATFYGWPVETLKQMRIQQITTSAFETVKSNMKKFMSGKENKGTFRHRLIDGSIRDVDVYSCPIRFHGKVLLYSIINDITDQKKILDALIDAKEKAEESDRLKTAFLANISHEIRTPMNGIIGFTDLLKDPQLSGKEQAVYIDLINQSGERMLNLINDIIDISRIDADETIPQLSRTPVNKLLNDIYAFFKPVAEKKGLFLSCTTGLPDSECDIETDSLKLNQILTNLVQNAIKFTQKGGIDIGYTRKDDTLEFYVFDSGIGIPEDMKKRIFERFRQVDNSLTRNYEGAGLGLSITKAFVEMLGGSIRVESKKGQGSEFLFTLPYKPVSSSRLPEPSAVAKEPAITLPGVTVVIAEDDDVSGILLKKNLQGENITIFMAKDGQEAVELVQEHPETDLVLMDIKMPVMNGYEATRVIKRLRPELPVIVQTAFTSKDDRQKAIDAGCDGFITKPINKNNLLELMRSLIRH